MESFVLSAALAFAICETLAFIRPPMPDEHHFHIGGLAIQFNERAARLARRVLMVILVVAILSFLLLVHELFLPIDLISRNRINVTFGFIFGPLFGIWLNSIIRHPPDRSLTKAQSIGGIGLVFLFFLGSVGNEAGKLINRYAQRINVFKFAGAELSFSEKSRRDVIPGVASNAPAGTGGKSFASSQGLQYLSNLTEWFVKRDSQYLSLFKASTPDLDRELVVTMDFSANVIQLPFACLFEWSQVAEDATAIEQNLRSFAEILRYAHRLDDDTLRNKFAAGFAGQSQTLISESRLVPELSAPCSGFFRAASAPDWIKERDLAALAANHEFQRRPYLAIVHASLMAQLGQYESAGAILFNWLDAKAKARPPAGNNANSQNINWPTADDWFEIRARSVLAAFTEEWLQTDEASVTTPLRHEHMRNLNVLRRDLRRLVSKDSFFAELFKVQSRSSFRIIEPNACQFTGSPEWRKLFTSYISMELAYINNTLAYPAYDENFATTTSDDVAALAQTDLSCANDDANLLYAQVIEAYTRNAILYTAARRKTESDDTRRERLDTALAVLNVGLELVKDSAVRDSGPEEKKRYVDRIAASDPIATFEALTANRKRLEALMEE